MTSKSKMPLAAVLLGLTALTACSDDAGATEDAGDAPACIGKCDGFNSITGALPLAPHAATWDGRVLLADVEGACRVVAVRPEAIDLREGGGLTFGPDVFSEGVECPTTVGAPALAMATPDAENPYASDDQGNADPDGGHQTYAVALVESTEDGALVRRSGTLIVAEDEVVSARWSDDGDALGIDGLNPTLSADGGLLVFERDETLWFALAQDDGFGEPAPLSELHLRADELVRGLPLAVRYPLAEQALRAADGTVLAAGAPLVGRRPSLGQDGTELFFEADGGTRVVSQRSGFALRHLDGHINARTDDAPAFHLSLGRSGSAYAPYPGAHRLPVRNHRLPAMSLFGFVDRDGTLESSYDEVDFAAFADQDYIAYLPMTPAAGLDGSLDAQRIADISGHFNTAVLDGGATLGHEAIPGAHGEALFLDSGAAFRVPASEITTAPDRGFNVSMFVRPMADDLDGQLFSWPGVVTVSLEDGQVATHITTTTGEHASGERFPLARDEWTHVAVSYDGPSGIMRVYFDGRMISQDSFSRGFPTGEGGALTFGGATGSASDAVLGLDEVSVSRVVRFDDEVYAEARREEFFRSPIANADRIREDADLPLGVDAEEYIMPDRANVEDATVELGMLLFFDNRLSRNGEVSCATCHDPEIAFTDGRALGPRIDGGDLNRATPTIFNRALSTRQFWDGRTPTLEQQALQPIFSPAEMDFTREEALALVMSSPEYVDRFNDVFGRDPTLPNMANALAAFQRAQLTGESPVDRYEAGETDALTAAEIRGRALFHGKARCDACHSGSNYADEELHNVGLLDDRDPGAFFTRRGRTRSLRAFKTPTLRNIDVTGPYFHDGSVETLEEVVALYVAGPSGDGVDPESRALDLDADEQADLVAFLRALTSPNAVQTFDVDLPAVE
ncbi:MAG: cytochrome c peroxidase [Myxococcota bacterium]